MEALIARAVQVLIALGGAYLLTLWFALVVWTFQDIQARSRSVVAQIFSTLVVMIFSIPGLLVYMILRPRYTLDDAFQRSLEEEYLMQDLEELPLCPGCQQYVEDDWVFCPNCRTELRDNCVACDRLIDLRWEICPYCGTEQYPEDEEALPAQPAQPLVTQTPQFLGQPQLGQSHAAHLPEGEERTRPIVPASVRVDLESGNIYKDAAPDFPLTSRITPLDGNGAPKRVSLGGDSSHDDENVASGQRASSNASSISGEDSAEAVGQPVPDPKTNSNGSVTEEPLPTPRKSKKRRKSGKQADAQRPQDK